jgi:hypothetical protein
MSHIILLGDSIFDNTRYTLGQPDVITQVRQHVPPDWQATLLAVDGSTTAEVQSQLERLPPGASHLVLSIGGNNAITNAGILNAPIQSSADALRELARVAAEFEDAYGSAVKACKATDLPLAVCTIYNGCFEESGYQQLVSTALMVFNDVILRVAIEFRLPVIDLRFICTSKEDYANPIEPSSAGGAKIAAAIVDLVRRGWSGQNASCTVLA